MKPWIVPAGLALACGIAGCSVLIPVGIAQYSHAVAPATPKPSLLPELPELSPEASESPEASASPEATESATP